MTRTSGSDAWWPSSATTHESLVPVCRLRCSADTAKTASAAAHNARREPGWPRVAANKGTTSAIPGGAKVKHRGDFCAAKLSLDRIIGWDELKPDAGRREMVVTYTYRIAAAPWTRNAEIQKVFPMVDRVIKGEGTMQLKQRFRLTEGGWAAVSLWD